MTDFFWRLGDILPDVAKVGYDLHLTVQDAPTVIWTPDPGATPLENYVMSELAARPPREASPRRRGVVVTGVLYGGRPDSLVPSVSMRDGSRSATVIWGTGAGAGADAGADAVILPRPSDARELEHLLIYLPIRFAMNKPLDVGYPFREELARVADLVYGMDARLRRVDVESRVRKNLLSDLERKVRRDMDAMTKTLARPSNYLVDDPFAKRAVRSIDGGSWVPFQ